MAKSLTLNHLPDSLHARLTAAASILGRGVWAGAIAGACFLLYGS